MVSSHYVILSAVGLIPRVLSANLLVSHFSGTVYTLSLATSGTTGTLSITSSSSGCGQMPSWLTLDSASGSLYCFDEDWYGSGVVSSFSVKSDGSLTQTGQATTTGEDVHGWFYGGTQGTSFLATAEYSASSITTYKLPLSSSSQALQKLKFTMAKPGPNSRQDAPHPHSTLPDPTGKYLLVPDLGADLIRIFSIDQSTGNLNACTAASTAAGDGPRHGVFWSPDGSTSNLMFYAVNELGNSVSAWKVSYPSSGCLTLTHTQTLSAYPAGKSAPSGSKSAEVHVFGNFLYLSNRNDKTFGAQEDSMATYTIDSSTGAITFLEATNAYSWYPRTFQINKAGTMVAIGGQTSANVAIVSRDTTTGRLGSLIANLQVGSKGTDGGEDGLSAVIWDE